MHKILLIATALLASAVVIAKEKKVVCYYVSWEVNRPGKGNFNPTDIDSKLCTHLIYRYAKLDPNGAINVRDPSIDLPGNGGKDGYNLVNQQRIKNPTLKTLIGIGGWEEDSAKFSQVASNSHTRKAFVQNAINFVKKYDFNGLDLHWWYPAQEDADSTEKENFVLLVKELREEFDKESLLLSAIVNARSTTASKSYNIPVLAKYLHFINLRTYYVYHGTSDRVIGNNAPLYAASWEQGNDLLLNVQASVHYWLSQGAPAEKLILGVPFYGISYTLADVSNTSIGAAASGPGKAGPYTAKAGLISYQEICEKQMKEKWTILFSEQQRVPFTFRNNQWISYENAESVTEKAKLVNKLGLGGAMIWSLDSDDFRGTCGEKYPLLKTVNHILRKLCLLGTLEDIEKSIFNVLKNYECKNEIDCNFDY